ncbi:Flagellar basal body rod protein FlgB [Massilia sp. Bi118]|jgi:flagellar basal-body rod protein FlgB|uniref:flagellar basal body rod protein FlgB n=1 Tax=Massilia sp. Bi118 TaxID=2822346 RepID=UPI001E01DD23|nr:flagellar basal body rod protein FlgB [Massilia sp. Bi118]CAH0196602.1 Flagellar basal body rod protein FlgB [Massilia sp. Bi118]
MNEIKSGIPRLTQTATTDKEEFFQRALQVSERRLNVLASNIANADTPNYKARDIDFKAALQQALLATSPATDPVDKSKCATSVDELDAFLMYRIPTQGAVDGNTVDLDQERSAFAEQAVRHQFLIQKVADEYKEMDEMLKNLIG